MPDPNPAQLRSETERESVDGAVIATVAFDGDLDLPVVDAFRAAASPEGVGDADGVILDLTGVRFIDSSGIHALVTAWKALGASGRPAKIVIGSESNVERVLEMTGLLEEIGPARDRAAAADAIAGRG